MSKGVTATMVNRGVRKYWGITIRVYTVYDKCGKEIGCVEQVLSGDDKGKVFCYALTCQHNRNYIQRVYNYYTHKED